MYSFIHLVDAYRWCKATAKGPCCIVNIGAVYEWCPDEEGRYGLTRRYFAYLAG